MQIASRGYIITRLFSLACIMISMMSLGCGISRLLGGNPFRAFGDVTMVAMFLMIALAAGNGTIFNDRFRPGWRRMAKTLSVVVNLLGIALCLLSFALLFRLRPSDAVFVMVATISGFAALCLPFSVIWHLRYRNEGGPDADAVPAGVAASR